MHLLLFSSLVHELLRKVCLTPLGDDHQVQVLGGETGKSGQVLAETVAYEIIFRLPESPLAPWGHGAFFDMTLPRPTTIKPTIPLTDHPSLISITEKISRVDRPLDTVRTVIMPKCSDTEFLFSCRESGEKPPASLCLSGQCVLDLDAPSTPLYRLSTDITSISNKHSSVIFERVKRNRPELETEDESVTVDESKSTDETYHNFRSQKGPLFYLAHPANAQYRSDIPAKYYITAVMPGMMGNIRLEASKSRFQRTSFKAMLSRKRTASDNPLFDQEAKQILLFDIQPTWTAGSNCYRWNDLHGNRLAVEENVESTYRLCVTSWMESELRDALVASWLLRLWHDTAESKQAKREYFESMAAPEAYQENMNPYMPRQCITM